MRTSKRVKYYNPIYKINPVTFDVEIDEKGNPILEEDFTNTISDFKDWCLSQEKTLSDLFVK